MNPLPKFEQFKRDEESKQVRKLLHIVTSRLIPSEDDNNHVLQSSSLFVKKSFVSTTSQCRRLISPNQPCVMSVRKWLLYVIIITLLIFISLVSFLWLLNRDNQQYEEDLLENDFEQIENETPSKSAGVYSKQKLNFSELTTTLATPLLALSQWQANYKVPLDKSSSSSKRMRHDWRVCKLNRLQNDTGDGRIIDYVSDDNRVKIVINGKLLIYSGGQDNGIIGFVPLNDIEIISTEQLDSLMPSISIRFTCATIELHFVQLDTTTNNNNNNNKNTSSTLITNERHYFVRPIGGEVSFQLDSVVDDDVGNQSIRTIKWSDVARVNFKFHQNSHYYCDEPWKSLTSRNKRKYHYAELQLSYLEYEINRSQGTDFNKFETSRGGVC